MMHIVSMIQKLSENGRTDVAAMELAADIQNAVTLLERVEHSLNPSKLDELIAATKQAGSQQRQLTDLLNELSRRERTCYLLHYVGQETFQSIADELNISKGAVQSYINRARKKLGLIAKELA